MDTENTRHIENALSLVQAKCRDFSGMITVTSRKSSDIAVVVDMISFDSLKMYFAIDRLSANV